MNKLQSNMKGSVFMNVILESQNDSSSEFRQFVVIKKSNKITLREDL